MSSKVDWPVSPAKYLPAPKKQWESDLGVNPLLQPPPPLLERESAQERAPEFEKQSALEDAAELEKESDAPEVQENIEQMLTPEVLEGRAAYEAEINGLREELQRLRSSGETSEAIARALHAKRREIGEKYKNLTPPKLLEEIYQRNLDRYGDKLGPTIDGLKDKGYDWDTIADKACTPGGKDLFGARPKQ